MGCDGAWLHAKVVWTVSVSSSRCRTLRTMYSVFGVSNTSRTRTMFSWLTWQGTRSWCVDKKVATGIAAFAAMREIMPP